MSKRKGNRDSKVAPDKYITLATAIANLITALILLYQKIRG